MSKTLGTLIRMSRPYYAILAVAAPVSGYTSASQFHFSFLRCATVASIFAMLAMAAWAGDDAFNASLDTRGRTKSFHGFYIAGGTHLLVTEKLPFTVVVAYLLLLLAVALSLAATISTSFFMLACLCAAAGIAYYLPPFHLKTRGLFGALVVSSSYGLVAFSAGRVATGSEIDISTLAFGGLMSILVFGYDGLGHIIDYSDDKANRINTFAVQLGPTRAVRLLAACQVLPVLILWALKFTGLLTINFSVIGVMLLITVTSAIVVLICRSEQHLAPLRLISVPILSASFFFLFSNIR